LQEIIAYAQTNEAMLNFIYSSELLPDEYDKMIKPTTHTKIAPVSIKNRYPDAISIIDSDKIVSANKLLANSADNNIIFRLKKPDLHNLQKMISSLLNRCNRITIITVDIEKYSQKELDEYGDQLLNIQKELFKYYSNGNTIELNAVSDRMFLTANNNCNAGIEHVTYAPDGNFYICPAFYFEGPENSIGTINTGINIKNEHLLTIKHAPICRNCDAFQCKRCLYTNIKSTLEINTPSREQCYASHLERNQSMRLLNRLQDEKGALLNLSPIKELNYLDPFDVLMNKEKMVHADADVNTSSNSSQNLSEKEILIKIYEMQEKILQKLIEKDKI
jgi:CXXX repeat peptide maturase